MATLLFTLAGVVAADQLSKWWIVTHFSMFEKQPVIPGLFDLTLVTNTGAAFGLFAGAPSAARQIFFVAVALLALVVMAVAYRHFRHQGRIFVVAIGLIAGGAVGNLFDRLRFGAVIDFLDFYLGTRHWPAFNLADSAITVGVGLFLLAGFLQPEEGRERKRD